MNNIKQESKYFIKGLDINNPPLKASRLGFGEAIVDQGKINNDIVVLGGDVSGSVKTDMFKEAFPDRFFSVGIAEQDMMGTAAGLAVAGKIPIASAYGEFAAGRPFDQIRQSIAYSEMNVKICASHCGITVGPDGATHQSLEDVALMRVLPNMNVITPCDANQTYKAVVKAINTIGPFYIRFYRDNSPNFTSADAPFEFGKADTLIDGNDCTIIACGLMVWESIQAIEILKREGYSVRLINMHTIKPIDAEAIVNSAKETGCIVTAEDHQKQSGLAGAVAEVLVQHYPAPVEFVAVQDTFGESALAHQMPDLLKKYKISKEFIVEAVKKVIKRK
jgi:transketolase